jgi:hypothetical protein
VGFEKSTSLNVEQDRLECALKCSKDGSSKTPAQTSSLPAKKMEWTISRPTIDAVAGADADGTYVVVEFTTPQQLFDSSKQKTDSLEFLNSDPKARDKTLYIWQTGNGFSLTVVAEPNSAIAFAAQNNHYFVEVCKSIGNCELLTQTGAPANPESSLQPQEATAFPVWIIGVIASFVVIAIVISGVVCFCTKKRRPQRTSRCVAENAKNEKQEETVPFSSISLPTCCTEGSEEGSPRQGDGFPVDLRTDDVDLSSAHKKPLSTSQPED